MTKDPITLSSTPVTVLTPAAAMKLGYIQNNGSNDARLTFDGTDPTDSKGFKLAAGMQVWLQQIYGSAMAGAPRPWPAIRAICTAGTTVDVGTDDNISQ